MTEPIQTPAKGQRHYRNDFTYHVMMAITLSKFFNNNVLYVFIQKIHILFVSVLFNSSMKFLQELFARTNINVTIAMNHAVYAKHVGRVVTKRSVKRKVI